MLPWICLLWGFMGNCALVSPYLQNLGKPPTQVSAGNFLDLRGVNREPGRLGARAGEMPSVGGRKGPAARSGPWPQMEAPGVGPGRSPQREMPEGHSAEFSARVHGGERARGISRLRGAPPRMWGDPRVASPEAVAIWKTQPLASPLLGPASLLEETRSSLLAVPFTRVSLLAVPFMRVSVSSPSIYPGRLWTQEP